MKKGDRPNPGEEFLYKLDGQAKFHDVLLNWRKIIGIPDQGLGKEVKWEKEWERLISNDRTAVKIMAAAQNLQWKFKIPMTYFRFIYLYLCFGYVPSEFWGENEFVKILKPDSLLNPGGDNEEKDLITIFREPYVKLLIPGTSRMSDVTDYLTKHWNKVEEILKLQGWEKPKPIRKTIHKQRNLLIKELWRKPTRELQKEAEFVSSYKERLIQKIMRKKGYKMTEGQIRKLRYQ